MLCLYIERRLFQYFFNLRFNIFNAEGRKEGAESHKDED